MAGSLLSEISKVKRVRTGCFTHFLYFTCEFWLYSVCVLTLFEATRRCQYRCRNSKFSTKCPSQLTTKYMGPSITYLFTGLKSRKVHTSKKTQGNRNGHIQTRAKTNQIPSSYSGFGCRNTNSMQSYDYY